MDTPSNPKAPVEATPRDSNDRDLDAQLIGEPRALTILTTEHWSLLSSRGLAYNESFTRANMYLTFVSMSLVALALFADATSFDDRFLAIAALVLGFDFLIGLLTAMRMVFAGLDDARATFGMNRIRNGYVRIAPAVERFFISGVHDDAPGLMKTLGLEGLTTVGSLGLTASTSGTMVGLIDALIGGTFAATILLNLGADIGWAVAGGAVVFAALVLGLMAGAVAYLRQRQSLLTSRFPTPAPRDQPDRAAPDLAPSSPRR
jgi:hypothetical protein